MIFNTPTLLLGFGFLLTAQQVLGISPHPRIDRDDDPDFEQYSGVVKTDGHVGANVLAKVAAKASGDMMALHHAAHQAGHTVGNLPGAMIAMQDHEGKEIVASSVQTKKGDSAEQQHKHGEVRAMEIFHQLHGHNPTGGMSVAYNVPERKTMPACKNCAPVLHQAGMADGHHQVTRPPTPPPAPGHGSHHKRSNMLNHISARDVQNAVANGILARALRKRGMLYAEELDGLFGRGESIFYDSEVY